MPSNEEYVFLVLGCLMKIGRGPSGWEYQLIGTMMTVKNCTGWKELNLLMFFSCYLMEEISILFSLRALWMPITLINKVCWFYSNITLLALILSMVTPRLLHWYFPRYSPLVFDHWVKKIASVEFHLTGFRSCTKLSKLFSVFLCQSSLSLSNCTSFLLDPICKF